LRMPYVSTYFFVCVLDEGCLSFRRFIMRSLER
jgi:hypothetical protein